MAHLSTFLDFANKHYGVHLHAFVIYAVIALALILIFGQWWLFWPTMVWFFLFGVHFLTFKSLNINSDWVDERITRTTEKAYDVSYIENLRERFDSSHDGSDRTQTDGKAPGRNETRATGKTEADPS